MLPLKLQTQSWKILYHFISVFFIFPDFHIFKFLPCCLWLLCAFGNKTSRGHITTYLWFNPQFSCQLHLELLRVFIEVQDTTSAEPPLKKGSTLSIQNIPLQQKFTFKLDKDINDSKSSRQACHTSQPLEAEFPREEASPFEPGSDVLPAQRLRLRHHLLHWNRPPAERRRKLSWNCVAHIGEPAIAPGSLGKVEGGDLVVVGDGGGGEAHLPWTGGKGEAGSRVRRAGRHSPLGRLQRQLAWEVRTKGVTTPLLLGYLLHDSSSLVTSFRNPASQSLTQPLTAPAKAGDGAWLSVVGARGRDGAGGRHRLLQPSSIH